MSVMWLGVAPKMDTKKTCVSKNFFLLTTVRNAKHIEI